MQIKHLFKLEREAELERSPERAKTLGNGTTGSTAVEENFDFNQPMALVRAIKADLQRSGFLNTPEAQVKFRQLEKLGQILQIGFKDRTTAAAQSFKIEREKLLAIVEQMRQASDVDTLLKTTVTQVRQRLQVERAIIYRFQDKDRGVVIAESLVSGYTPSLGETIAALMFGASEDSAYLQQQVLAIDDIYQLNLSPYQIQIIERFQVTASISLPIVIAGEVWGLLVVQQCSGLRQWQENEINLLYQIVSELTINLQPVEFRAQLQSVAQQQKVLARVIEKIQQSPDIGTIFRTATQELRTLLKADRVAIYRFNSDWSGEFVAESVAAGWDSVIQAQEREQILKADLISSDRCTLKNLAAYSTSDADTYLQETRGGGYARGERFKCVNDVYAAGFSPCYLETLEKFQARAYIIVPIFQDTKLWGLLGVYQNSGSRHWEDSEINTMMQLSTFLAIALQQAQIRDRLQLKIDRSAKFAELERAIVRIINKIQQSLDISSIFRTTTQELRQLLKADRVVLYRFNPDESGEFVAESVAPGWLALLKEQEQDPSLKNSKFTLEC
ncbi:MAG TPA: chemotaxis protein, partial [Cyanobacteria bacterium UBA11049]|nr:chemotaxis protein [Cyanobacteria bacterium UBA11049]